MTTDGGRASTNLHQAEQADLLSDLNFGCFEIGLLRPRGLEGVELVKIATVEGVQEIDEPLVTCAVE